MKNLFVVPMRTRDGKLVMDIVMCDYIDWPRIWAIKGVYLERTGYNLYPDI